MSSDLIPFNDPPERLSRQVAKRAKQAKQSSDLEVYRYGLGAAARSLMDQYDTEAAHDAADAAMKAELRLLKDGLSEVGGSASGAELVARWVSHFSSSNHRRYGRRFGG